MPSVGIGWIYLKGRWHPFRYDEATICCPLRVILGHEIIGDPNSVWVLFGRARVQRRAAIPGAWGEYHAVLERNISIGDLQRLEELRLGLGG